MSLVFKVFLLFEDSGHKYLYVWIPCRIMLGIATFGAGNFWEAQAVFDRVEGVVSTVVGYEGGTGECCYEDAEDKGHAEVVKIDFDFNLVSYEELLRVFWELHDFEEAEQKGEDEGLRYRSVIFYHDISQKNLALKSLAEEQERIGIDIPTEILPTLVFYEAEKEHQNYLEKFKGGS